MSLGFMINPHRGPQPGSLLGGARASSWQWVAGAQSSVTVAGVGWHTGTVPLGLTLSAIDKHLLVPRAFPENPDASGTMLTHCLSVCLTATTNFQYDYYSYGSGTGKIGWDLFRVPSGTVQYGRSALENASEAWAAVDFDIPLDPTVAKYTESQCGLLCGSRMLSTNASYYVYPLDPVLYSSSIFRIPTRSNTNQTATWNIPWYVWEP